MAWSYLSLLQRTPELGVLITTTSTLRAAKKTINYQHKSNQLQVCCAYKSRLASLNHIHKILLTTAEFFLSALTSECCLNNCDCVFPNFVLTLLWYSASAPVQSQFAQIRRVKMVFWNILISMLIVCYKCIFLDSTNMSRCGQYDLTFSSCLTKCILTF